LDVLCPPPLFTVSALMSSVRPLLPSPPCPRSEFRPPGPFPPILLSEQVLSHRTLTPRPPGQDSCLWPPPFFPSLRGGGPSPTPKREGQKTDMARVLLFVLHFAPFSLVVTAVGAPTFPLRSGFLFLFLLLCWRYDFPYRAATSPKTESSVLLVGRISPFLHYELVQELFVLAPFSLLFCFAGAPFAPSPRPL